MGAQAINVAARMPRRVAYFDVLNILATISVVWIHFGNEVHWYDGSKVWYWCLFIQVVCYWAVPVFFMLTGATLMNYQEKYSTKEFYLHRVKRSLLPYLVFGGILALCQVYKGDLVVDAAHPLLSILDIFMNNRMEPIYWFFPVLFGIYLAMPALSVFAKPENRKQLDYLVSVGIITVSILPFLAQSAKHLFGVWEISSWNTALELPVLGSYLIYPVLGYWASTRDFTRRGRILCYVGAVLSAILRFVGLKLLGERDGVINQLFMDYRSVPSLLLALGVFVFVRYAISDRVTLSNRWKKVLKELSTCSLGVYLIHHPILAAMEKIPFFAKYSSQWYFFWPFVCYVGCASVVFFGRACLKQLTSR